MSEANTWYVRRGKTIGGPYRTPQIKRYLVLGRITADDELSSDRETWLPATSCPPFAAEGLIKGQDLAVVRREDERRGDRREETPAEATSERRRGADRRTPE